MKYNMETNKQTKTQRKKGIYRMPQSCIIKSGLQGAGEDLSLGPRTHVRCLMATCHSSSRGSGASGPHRHLNSYIHTHMWTHTYS